MFLRREAEPMFAPRWLAHTVALMARLRVFLYVLAGLILVDILVATQSTTWRAYAPIFYRDRVEACRRTHWDLVLIGGSPAMSGLDADLLCDAYWQGQSLHRV